MSGYTPADYDAMYLALDELNARRLEAAIANSYKPGRKSGRGYEEAMAEVTTQADIDLINSAMPMLDPFAKLLTHLHTDVWREFRQGIRCSVCGMTSAQSKAAGHNCSYDC